MLSQPLIRITSHPLNCSPVKITSLSFVHLPPKSDRPWKPAPLRNLRPGTRERRGRGEREWPALSTRFFQWPMDYPFKFPQSDFDRPRFYSSKSTNTSSIYFTRPVLRGCAYLPFQPTIMLNVSPKLANGLPFDSSRLTLKTK